eukprot:7264173-Prymnesium_polylepis.1
MRSPAHERPRQFGCLVTRIPSGHRTRLGRGLWRATWMQWMRWRAQPGRGVVQAEVQADRQSQRLTPPVQKREGQDSAGASVLGRSEPSDRRKYGS